MQNTKENASRMDLGWWGPAVMLVVLTAAEFAGAFTLISKVSTLATSWQWSPTSTYDVVGR
jgi:hypothetical protein